MRAQVRFLAFSLSAMALVASCGGSTGSPSAGSPTPTITTATVEQIASIIAKHERGLRDSAAKAEGCQFRDSPDCTLSADLSAFTFSTQAQTLTLVLEAADDGRLENSSFIGAYPSSLQGIIEDTLASLALVAETQKAFGERCLPKTRSRCEDLNEAFFRALDDLIRQLDAWAPYL